MEKEICIRCGKPTPYSTETPVTARLYFVEGSGQLCPDCWREVYGEQKDQEFQRLHLQISQFAH